MNQADAHADNVTPLLQKSNTTDDMTETDASVERSSAVPTSKESGLAEN